MARPPKLPPFVQRRGKRYRGWAVVAGNRIYGRSHEDPLVAHAEAVAMRSEGRSLSQETPTLLDAMTVVLEAVETNRREGTRRWYQDQFKILLAEWEPTIPLSDITPEAISRFVRRQLNETRDIMRKDGTFLRKGRPITPSTIDHYRRAMNRIFRVAIREGWIDRNPCERVEWPRWERPKMHYFTMKELGEIVQRVRAELPDDADTIELLAYTGLRRSEAARLRVEDIDFRDQVVWVLGKTRREPLPFSPHVVDCLKRIVKRAADGVLFPGGINQVERPFRRWSAKLKEPRLHPHSLRHSLATALLRDGERAEVVQQLMRHRSFSTTLRYVHVASDELRRGAARLRLVPPASGPEQAAGS